MKRNRRKFFKYSLGFFSLLLSKNYLAVEYNLKKKIKIYKKKYAKIWILDVNDS
tara:strand:+ start:1217 stop:1378 length:162 start_codon:yes stop_codon:yes gene_type:complete